MIFIKGLAYKAKPFSFTSFAIQRKIFRGNRWREKNFSCSYSPLITANGFNLATFFDNPA